MRPPPPQHSEGENPSGAGQKFDIISAIEELNGLSSQELNKSKDSENFSVQYKTEKGSLKQLNTESLPLHLIASLLSPDRDMRLGHVLVVFVFCIHFPMLQRVMLDLSRFFLMM